MTNLRTKRREQWLLVLFPAALLLAAYSVFVALPAQKRLQVQQAKFQVAQAQAVSPEDAEMSRIQLENARTSLQRLKSSITHNREKLRELSLGWRRDENRLATFQKITESLRYYDLSVVFQGYMSDPEISTYNSELIGIFKLQESQNELEYWQIELQGSFLNVTQFLESINSEELGVITASVSMKPAEDQEGRKKWTVLFLI